MKTPEIEEVDRPLVGRLYWVPAIRTSAPSYWISFGANAIVPIIGDLHEDSEVIGFEEMHWHPDFRFISDRWVKQRTDGYGGSEWAGKHAKSARIFGHVISQKNTEGDVVRVKRKCRRPHPTFPPVASWLDRLEQKYAEARIKCDVCPHRGISLKGAPVRNGARVCPGHGLAWSVKDGSLVRRTGKA